MREITIIGGGLAGLALGISLRRMDVPATLIEAGQYPKHKVCGEFICGVSPQVLSEMGLDNIVRDSVHHRQMSWSILDEPILQREMPQVAWGLSRYQLDLDLSHEFQRLGGQLHLRTRHRIASPAPEGTVLGAGKHQRRGREQWIGLKLHAQDVSSLEGLEMHVGRAGYLGLCGVENARVNCCGLFRINRRLKGKGSALLLAYLRENGLHTLAQRMRAWELDESSFSATAGFSLGRQRHRAEMSIGDAAALIPPFTGNGMSMALESAHLAGQALHQYATGSLSWHECQSQYHTQAQRHFRKRLILAQALHPLFFHPIGHTLLRRAAPCGLLPINTLFHHLRTP